MFFKLIVELYNPFDISIYYCYQQFIPIYLFFSLVFSLMKKCNIISSLFKTRSPFWNSIFSILKLYNPFDIITCYQQLFPKSAFLSQFFFASMKNCNISSLVFPSKMWKLVEVLQEISPLSEQDFLRKCIQVSLPLCAC